MIVFVTGTGTEVGKTWVAAAALRRLRARGVSVAARKPAQSFAPGDGPTDAEVLGAASAEDPERVCPAHRWFEVPLAPPMAAEVLGLPPFTIADLAEELVAPAHAGALLLVEGAGGIRSPMASDGDNRDFATAIAPDVTVVVGGAELGSINTVRLTVDAVAGAVVPPERVVVMLNRFEPASDLHVRNRDTLAGDGLTVVTDPTALVECLAGLLDSRPT